MSLLVFHHVALNYLLYGLKTVIKSLKFNCVNCRNPVLMSPHTVPPRLVTSSGTSQTSSSSSASFCSSSWLVSAASSTLNSPLCCHPAFSQPVKHTQRENAATHSDVTPSSDYFTLFILFHSYSSVCLSSGQRARESEACRRNRERVKGSAAAEWQSRAEQDGCRITVGDSVVGVRVVKGLIEKLWGFSWSQNASSSSSSRRIWERASVSTAELKEHYKHFFIVLSVVSVSYDDIRSGNMLTLLRHCSADVLIVFNAAHKHNVCVILYFQQIPWKDQNWQRVRPSLSTFWNPTGSFNLLKTPHKYIVSFTGNMRLQVAFF